MDDRLPRPHLVVVRHGETEWARAGRHTGRTDIPLTDVGEAAARKLADRLAGRTFAEVWSSPLRRAWRTAELAGYGDRVTPEPDLVEWDYGDDEGRTTPEIRAGRPGWFIWRDGPQGGETLAHLAARADRVIERVLGADGDVLVFAHGHLLDVLAARWVGVPAEFGRIFYLDPATVSRLGWHHENRVIQEWNGAC
jgi:broad specificity phosphatase PhoE